jgi:hypothetical protein
VHGIDQRPDFLYAAFVNAGLDVAGNVDECPPLRYLKP